MTQNPLRRFIPSLSLLAVLASAPFAQANPDLDGCQDLSFGQTLDPIRGISFVAPDRRVFQIEAPRIHVFDRQGTRLATRTGAGRSRIRNGFIDSSGRLVAWGELDVIRLDATTLADDAGFTAIEIDGGFQQVRGVVELQGLGYLFGLEAGTQLDGVDLPPLALFDFSGNFVSDLGFGFTNFSPSFPPACDKILKAPDGKVIVTMATARFSDGSIVPPIIRLNADGTLDPSFTYTEGDVDHVDASGRILYRFSSGDRQIRRLNADGTRDLTFNVADERFEDDVNGMVTEPSGKIIVYGEFQDYGGVRVRGHARLNPDGTLDTSYDGFDGFSLETSFFTDRNTVHPIAHASIDPEGGIYLISASTNSGFRDSRQLGLVRVFGSGAGAANGFTTFVEGLPADQRGESDDPDNDRLENGIEYAYGFDPSEVDAIELVTDLGAGSGAQLNASYPSANLEAGSDYVTFAVWFPSELVPGVTLELQSGTDLGNLGDGSIGLILLDTEPAVNGLERRIYAYDLPLRQASRAFTRLQATLAP